MRLLPAFFMLLGLVFFTNAVSAQDLSEGKEIFNGRCVSCHTINDGKRVGPELAGINDRREEEWLISFIRNSQAMIEEGDEIAKKLYNKYNKVVMPNHEDLDESQIKNLLAYIADEASSSQESAAQASESEESEGSEAKSAKKAFSHQPKAKDLDQRLLNPHGFDFLATFWMTLGLVVLAAFGFIGIVIYFTS